MLVAARDAGVGKVVHTSSSAVFGIPEHNPVTEDDAVPRRSRRTAGPSCEAELLCHDAVAAGLDVTIVRPRTILGHGRLGIMAILFEFVADGAPVFVLGGGDNRYQFVHADDLADACLRAADRAGPGDLQHRRRPSSARCARRSQALVDHAGTGSRVRSLPAGAGPARACSALARLGAGAVRAVPLAAVQRVAVVRHRRRRATELGWEPHALERVDGDRVVRVVPRPPRTSSATTAGSHHQSPVRLGPAARAEGAAVRVRVAPHRRPAGSERRKSAIRTDKPRSLQQRSVHPRKHVPNGTTRPSK